MKKLPFYRENEEKTIESALSVFVAQLEENGSMTQYRAHIKNLKLFKVVIGQVVLGLCFTSPPDRLRVCGRSCR